LIHVAVVAPYFGENMRHCLRCFADLPDTRLGGLSQESSERLPPELRSRVDAFQTIGDASDGTQLAEGARALKKQWGRLDRIEGYLEHLQVPIAEARDALDVDGMRAEAAKNFRDKNRMKEVLRRAGVPVARQALIRSADDARGFAAQVGYPIVLKPLAGLGARDTQRAHDETSLSSAMNVLLPTADKPAQAEEFVRCEEHTFEAATIGGKTVWYSSTQYLPSPLQVLENAWMQYCLLLPRETDPPHVRAFADVNARALEALGMQNGLSHMEWFLREDGSPAVAADEKLCEVPTDVAGERRVLARERDVERVAVGSIHIELVEERECDAVFRRAEFLDLLVRARLLTPELIARKPEHDEAIVLVLRVECLERRILGRVAALRRDVHDQQHLALVRRESRVLPIDVLHGNVVDVRGESGHGDKGEKGGANRAQC
jgi:hypothetical protein